MWGLDVETQAKGQNAPPLCGIHSPMLPPWQQGVQLTKGEQLLGLYHRLRGGALEMGSAVLGRHERGEPSLIKQEVSVCSSMGALFKFSDEWNQKP